MQSKVVDLFVSSTKEVFDDVIRRREGQIVGGVGEKVDACDQGRFESIEGKSVARSGDGNDSDNGTFWVKERMLVRCNSIERAWVAKGRNVVGAAVVSK